MEKLKNSELILNPDGSIYHLHLLPEQLSDDIILVGDPGRVEMISSFFESIECKITNREFVTHTGSFKGKRISVISTGIGTDNIDIVINELDAVVNIDLKERNIKDEKKSLNIIRLGTSGALQEDIEIDSFVASEYGLGLDGLLNFYKDSKNVVNKELTDAFIEFTKWNADLAKPYIVKSNENLMNKLARDFHKGITATAPGFYAPQGRKLRLETSDNDINYLLKDFSFASNRITNFEMETSALYGLGKLLGHNTLTICAIIANRFTKKYSKDYKKTVAELVELVLNRLSKE